MGQFFQIKCPKCGDENQYMVGRGFIPLDESAYKEIRKASEYALLKSQVKSPDDFYDSCYKAYYCKECKTLENHISFRLRNKPSFRMRRRCNKCGKIMVGMVDLDKFYLKEKIINCSKCGAEDIFDQNTDFGLWD